MHLRLSPVLLLFVSSLCPAQTAPIDPPKAFTVHGRALQDPGGQPLRKADVRLTAQDGQRREDRVATTDSEGKFELENIAPGRYSVFVERAGFFQVGAHGRFGARLLLDSPADAKDVVLHMQLAAVITGKIVDDDGDPIPNVAVQATKAGAVGGRFNNFSGYGSTNDLGRISDRQPPSREISVERGSATRTAQWGF